MADVLYLGNFPKGQINVREAFVIDNESFPFLYNFFVWRGRARKKRGTTYLGQLRRQVKIVAVPTTNWEYAQFALVAGEGNLITDLGLESTSTISPDSISLVVDGETYTSPSPANGTLIGDMGGTGTINFASGDFTIVGGGVFNVTGQFSYMPGLPVMGLQDFTSSASTSLYPSLLAFDTKYSYEINENNTFEKFYSSSYYRGSQNPVLWSGADYQLFWTTNYENALWATNNKAGFHFVNGSVIAGTETGTTISFEFTKNAAFVTNLVAGTSTSGDKLWFNEWENGSTINGVSGYVSAIIDASMGQYQVTFDVSVTATNGATNQIAQLLTNSITGQDGIKWYNGDAAGLTGFPTNNTEGWVNFAPPLTGSNSVSIAGYEARLYYLVGALAIVPFKDRLIFFSPMIQASTGSFIILQDTALWSWDGTPYYTVNASGAAFNVPTNATAALKGWYVDQTGLGGYLSAGIQNPIKTVTNNEDALIVGFGGNGRKTRFVWTGNDFQPFLFFNINNELPSSSTFAAITLDQGSIDVGPYGLAMTDQQSSKRIDNEIPDAVFEFKSTDNGSDRVNGIRDFANEWIYFTYPVNNSEWKFPTQSLILNYKDWTWGVLYENYTVHGNYRPRKTQTWGTLPYKTWAEWREPWNAGTATQNYPFIIAGNPQGYVLQQSDGTGEGRSGTISALSDDGMGNLQITSYNHCVTASNGNLGNGQGDYLYISNAIFTGGTRTVFQIYPGTQTTIALNFGLTLFTLGQPVLITGVVGMTELNGNEYEVTYTSQSTIKINVDTSNFNDYISGGTVTTMFNDQVVKVISTPDENNFVVDLPYQEYTYLGLGTFTRLCQPLLKTKQFNFYWQDNRQLIMTSQKYLFDTTTNSEVTINFYLSQDDDQVWNSPQSNPPPNSLVYSQIVYTCPESTNLGLTPANSNLQMPTAETQNQIWHRYNTSMVGDSVQLGVTLSDSQMRDIEQSTSEITLHAVHLSFMRGPLLA